MLLICGIDCSTYLWQKDGFAEFSKQLRQTPSLAGPRAAALFQSEKSVSGAMAFGFRAADYQPANPWIGQQI